MDKTISGLYLTNQNYNISSENNLNNTLDITINPYKTDIFVDSDKGSPRDLDYYSTP